MILRILRTLFLVLLDASATPVRADPTARVVEIDAAAPDRPFPHVWEQMMGSGRAALTMRAAWRRDLRDVKAVTDLKYIRFHAIFHDELGVYDEEKDGTPKYNFQYVDQIYDGLLANGVRPFVELSFMPKALAARPDHHAFWYRPLVSPPKDYARWDALITAFARHLVDRYGIGEVSQWYFEVWNEPNIDFWTGRPAQKTYFELYDHTASALKAVDARLRVGGPSTAASEWVPETIAHTVEQKVPLDFVSTHVYGDDPPETALGPGAKAARFDVACPAMQRVRAQVKASARPDLPLFYTEINVTSGYREPIAQGLGIGTWLAETIARCDGAVDLMSYWSISDVFEEQGVMPHPFFGGYGVMAQDNIPKPAFSAFRLLHRLGDRRLAVAADNVIATRRADATIVVAAWNRVLPGSPDTAKDIDLKFASAAGSTVSTTIFRVDQEHGDTLRLYDAMGSPPYPTAAQVARLRDAGMQETAEVGHATGGVVKLHIPANGLVLVELRDSSLTVAPGGK